MVWCDMSEVAENLSIWLDQSIDAIIDEEQVASDDYLEDPTEDGDSYVVPINNLELSQIYDCKVVFQFNAPFDPSARVKPTMKIKVPLLFILNITITTTNPPPESDK